MSHNLQMKTATILIVEDNFSWREMYKEILDDSGYFWDEAYSYKDAIEKLRNNLFNVALLDLFLDFESPFLGGIEVLKWLVENNRDTKILIISGVSQLTDNDLKTIHNLMRSRKVVGFIAKKKLDPVEFKARIKEIIEDYTNDEKSLILPDL